MTIQKIIRLVPGVALLFLLGVMLSACADDSPTPAPTTQPVTIPTVTILPPATPTPIPNTPTPIPTAAPALPSPAEILRETTAAMAAVQSVHVEMNISTAFMGREGFTATVELHVSGDFQLPDRTQGTITPKFQGDTPELEFISIGVESYIRNPLTGEWEANLDADGLLGDFLAAPAFNTNLLVEGAPQFELVGIESLDDASVYHVGAEITGADLAELMDDRTMSTAEGEVAYWIGVDDFLVRKVEILAEQESATAHFVIALSNYNQEVEIVAPEVATPW